MIEPTIPFPITIWSEMMRSIGFEPQPPNPKHQNKSDKNKQCNPFLFFLLHPLLIVVRFFLLAVVLSVRSSALMLCMYTVKQNCVRAFIFSFPQHSRLLPLFHALKQPLKRPNQPHQNRHHRRPLRERLGNVGLIKGLPDLDRAFANQARSRAH